MSSVSDILQQMAENAGRRELARGQTYGSLISNAANIPAQILADREQRARAELQRQRETQQMIFAQHADTRAQTDQAREDAKNAQELKDRGDWKTITSVMYKPDGTYDYPAAYQKAHDIGRPDLGDEVQKHAAASAPKVGEAAPGTAGRYLSGPLAGQLVPNSTVPKPGADYTINGVRFSGETNKPLGEAVPLQTPPRAVQPEAFNFDGMNVKGVFDANANAGKGGYFYNGEDVTSRARMPPPASVQVQNMVPRPAGPPTNADRAIANYQVSPPSPRAFSTIAGQQQLERILAVNPDYDSGLFTVRAPTRKAYTTGAQGQQLVAMNTAIEHLDQLQAAADALKNGTFKPGNAVYNWAADTFGSGAPTSFATIKEKVDKELDAVASKGVPTVSGAAAQKLIGGMSTGPEGIKNYIDTSIRLLGSSHNALRTPYQAAMGANAPFDFMSPQAKAVLQKRGFNPDDPAADFGAGASGGGGGAAKEGDTKPIINPTTGQAAPGMVQTFTGGRWIRTK